MEKAKKVTKKTVTKKASSAPEPKLPAYLVGERDVDYKTRTVLLLDSRNDLVPFFFSGLDAMSANYQTKAINFFVDFVYKTCQGFIETVRERSIKAMEKKNPQFGIGDILRNRKGQKRFIINLYLDPKDNSLSYTWVDPEDARAPRSACSEKTMLGWIEK